MSPKSSVMRLLELVECGFFSMEMLFVFFFGGGGEEATLCYL